MKNLILNTRPLHTDIAALLLRLIFGGLFFYHGYDSLVHYKLYLSYSKDIIGIPAKLAFVLVIYTQFFCGLFIAFGFLTRIMVLPIAFAMSVAVLVAHAKDTFQVKELPFLYLLLTTVVFVMGSGKYSLDHLLFRKKP